MRKITVLFVVLFALIITSCGPKSSAPAPLPEVKIAVAWFNQPRSIDDLLAGVMVSEQDRISDKQLVALDGSFQQVIAQNTKRQFINIPSSYTCQVKVSHVAKGNGTALEYWSKVGACIEADMIVVPQITYLQDRTGSGLGSEKPSAVTMDFYLVDVKKAQLINRYHFEETQQSLTDNVLNIGSFVERSGRWITADELAREGMKKSIKELGL